MRAKAGDDIRQSELIAESASDIDRVIRIFLENREIGSGADGRGTANKMWVSRDFFLSPTFRQ